MNLFYWIVLLFFVSKPVFSTSVLEGVSSPKQKNGKVTCYIAGTKVYGPMEAYEIINTDLENSRLIPATYIYLNKESINNNQYDVIISNASCVTERI